MADASMVKCAKKENAPIYSNHNFFGQTPKSSSKVLFELDFIHGDLYCCVKTSNVEYQDDIFRTYR